MPGKRQRLINHIRTAIMCGNYRTGDKLPSIRVFAEQFKISFTTARSAMIELQQDGLIELCHGNGIFVRNDRRRTEPGTPLHRIGVFVADAISVNPDRAYVAHSLRGLQEEAALHNCRINLHFKEFYNAKAAVKIRPDEAADSDVLVFLGSYDMPGIHYPEGFPAVGLSMYLPEQPDFSGIGIDPFAAAVQAAEFFRRHQVRKVRLITESFGFGRLFKYCFGGVFAPFGQVEEVLHADNHLPPELFTEPAGYLFTSGTVCQFSLLSYLERYGRPLNVDRQVLAIDGKSRYLPDYLPVSNLGIDWMEAGRNLLTECLYRIGHSGRRGRQIYLTPDLQETN